MVKREPPAHDDTDIDMDRAQPPPDGNNTHASMPFRAPSAPISVRSAATTPFATETNDSTSASTAPTTNSDVDMQNVNSTPSASAMQTMGQPARELIKAIQRLEALSIKTTLPSLPKFVVVGDQSAGKSSLIEAACAITLPRSEGTCTRCPFQITTTASKEGQPDWSCKVVLHMKYMPNEDAHNDGEPFDGWASMEKVMELPFAQVNAKEDLDLVLRKAQLAILNPETDPALFKGLNAADVTRKQHEALKFRFSPNVISLEITGLELPDLSLFDLPGAINATENHDDQYLVDFIEALLTVYIRDEAALILLACAANQDVHTSTAFRYIRKHKAMPRCMGVLTKPDLLEGGKTKWESIQKMLHGDSNTFQMGLGWYTTKQLSQKEMESGISHEEARQREAAFFAQDPWSGSLSPYAARFGIRNLQKALSELLTTDIINNLPEILHRVQSRLQQVNGELASFPEEAAAPSLTVITEIDTLKTAIIKEIDPNSAESSFRSGYQNAFRKLSDNLLANKPDAVLETPGFVKPSISLDDSQEDYEMDETPSKRIKTNSGGSIRTPIRPTPSRETPSSSRMQNTAPNGRRRTAPQQSQQQQQAAPHRHRIIFKLGEIRERYDSAPGADMPGSASVHVDRKLKLEPLQCWTAIVDHSLSEIEVLFTKTLKQTVARALTPRKRTEFFSQALQICRDLLGELHHEQVQFAYKMIRANQHRPITYAKQTWKATVSTIETALRRQRSEQRIDELYDVMESNGQRVPPKPDQKKKGAAEFAALLVTDEWEPEIKALAPPIAYYELAAQQLVDELARTFEEGLMWQYQERLQRCLLEGLRAMDADHCANLLAEDPVRDRERRQLLEEKRKLEQALADLKDLPAAHAQAK
ncbi:Interferon-induced GTP-binding [Lecanosticta acicola]|uniref:Interferon-induced GTP-binding n=1 Tax=Lecanosticta acicola TaxID=111012 RepID=A0AAI8Z7E8_9PEZI|nr:Interferon-induced GTP-binding [Lecanosticta acicola]